MKFIILTCALIAFVSARQPTQYDSIVRSSSDIHPDGSYSYEYETGNGVSAAENGIGGQYAQGRADWISPEGVPVQLSYTADANGYHPTGSHVHPVPAHIVRSLQYIRAYGPKDGDYEVLGKVYGVDAQGNRGQRKLA